MVNKILTARELFKVTGSDPWDGLSESQCGIHSVCQLQWINNIFSPDHEKCEDKGVYRLPGWMVGWIQQNSVQYLTVNSQCLSVNGSSNVS